MPDELQLAGVERVATAALAPKPVVRHCYLCGAVVATDQYLSVGEMWRHGLAQDSLLHLLPMEFHVHSALLADRAFVGCLHVAIEA